MLIATLVGYCAAQLAVLEPKDKILLGAWLDTSPGKDTPTDFNARIGKRASFFQFAENLPLDFNNPPPIQLLAQSDTSAHLYLTVYALPNGLDSITDTVISDFVKQIAGITKQGRSVFIRLFPEMNGSWFPFGQKPLQFIEIWKKIVQAVRSNTLTTGKVAFVWGPNIGFGYPYPGQQYSFKGTSGPDFKVLDTNGDGKFDGSDDPYSPYYPGDEFVDWVGLSTYYFGRAFPWIKNELPEPTKFDDLLRGKNGNGGVDFYELYSVRKNKPLMITESGASFHLNFVVNRSAILDPGPGELNIKQAYWKQYITKSDIRAIYPKLKGICLFEFVKDEEDTLRDFQVTSPKILDAFKTDLNTVSENYIFAENGSPSKNLGLANSPRLLSGIILGSALICFLL